MTVRLLLLKRFIFGIAGVGIPSQRDIFGHSVHVRSYTLCLRTGMSGFYKYPFYDTGNERTRESMHQPSKMGKMGRSSAFLVDFCLFGATGGLRFQTSFFWNERPGQTKARIIYIGRRFGDDRDGNSKA
jgi:hypothetical protein